MTNESTNAASNQQLEPCPFGPVQEHPYVTVKEVNAANGKYWWAGCELYLSPSQPPKGCGVGHSALTKEEAIRKWNSRVSDGGVVVTVDARSLLAQVNALSIDERFSAHYQHGFEICRHQVIALLTAATQVPGWSVEHPDREREYWSKLGKPVATTPSPDAQQHRICSNCGEDLGFNEGDPCSKCV